MPAKKQNHRRFVVFGKRRWSNNRRWSVNITVKAQPRGNVFAQQTQSRRNSINLLNSRVNSKAKNIPSRLKSMSVSKPIKLNLNQIPIPIPKNNAVGMSPLSQIGKIPLRSHNNKQKQTQPKGNGHEIRTQMQLLRANHPSNSTQFQSSSTATKTTTTITSTTTNSGVGLFPTRAIMACDENHKYIQFWEPMAAHWKTIHGIKPTLIFVGDPSLPINKTIGDVVMFPVIPGIPTSYIAQIVRLLAPSMFPNDICVLCDIDLFLLDKSFFARHLSNVPKNNFASLNRYPSTIDKISMCYQVAKGNVFANIFQCNGQISTMVKMIQGWSGTANDWGTDEKILTNTLKSWTRNKLENANRWTLIMTSGLWGSSNSNCRTISRYLNNSWYDENKLKQKYYIEFEPPRSLMENLAFIKHILDVALGGFVIPLITYMGKNTGPSRHPFDSNPRSKGPVAKQIFLSTRHKSIHRPINQNNNIPASRLTFNRKLKR